MRYAIILTVIFLSCKDNSDSVSSNESTLTFLDRIRHECRSAKILFFYDFSTSKTSVVAKKFNDQKSLDTLFNYIGDQKTDTNYGVFSSSPLGEIYFYRDSSSTVELLNLYFVLNDKFEGFYAGIDKTSQKFYFSPLGRTSIQKLYKDIKPSLKK